MSEKLNWRTKETGRAVGSINRADVRIKGRKSGTDRDGKQRWAVTISFKAGMDKAITSTEHLKYAIDGNRLYFAQAEKEVGYKICRYSTTGTRAVTKITDDELMKFEGSYNLKFDRNEGAYYIEKGAAL